MAAIVVSDPLSAAVVLDGEIDISTCPAIRRLLMAAISGGDVHLAVDMSGVTFIDASGIGVLVAAANRARQAGGSLSLLAPSQQVRRLLDVFHLDAILPTAGRLGGPPLPAAPPEASPGPAATTKNCGSRPRADRPPMRSRLPVRPGSARYGSAAEPDGEAVVGVPERDVDVELVHGP
jgi:anti-sigma B factor antagonist